MLPVTLAFGLGPCGIGSAIGKLKSSSTAMASSGFVAACLIGSLQVVRLRREPLMDEAARTNRDFSKGPVWDPEKNRWLVEIRYPDGSRLRKRFRREREALRIW